MSNQKRPFCPYSNDYTVWASDTDENGQAVSMSCHAQFRYFQEALDYLTYCLKAGNYAVWRYRRPDGTFKTGADAAKLSAAGQYIGADHTGYRQVAV
ncbi:MAG: hypothetical protein HUU03_13595 [Planctomycetaceae bacterium]|nr:hypothetical protein [Planctomycetaceae bacterium]